MDRFCPSCAGELEVRLIDADQRHRQVCRKCGAIHYRNPRILVTGMITCGERLLLCRRAHEPALGLWTPPAGFMELGETLEQAAARETEEESGVRVDPQQMLLYTVTNLPEISEVYVSFRASVNTEACRAGPESLQVGYFSEPEVPWAHLAYPEMGGYLKMFFRELLSSEKWIHVSRADQSTRIRRGYRILSIQEPSGSARPADTT